MNPTQAGRSRWPDFHHTGPGTLAGRYLRTFWQPVYHSADLKPGKARTVRIMSVEYALYRGEDGRPHLVDARCPHRGMKLAPGWVEGDSIRCFYHGWKYDPSGQCIEQPAEPRPFAKSVKIGSYPCEDYLGFVFAWLGEGTPPPLPRFPDFENADGLLEWDSYLRRCNWFNNAENSVDLVHSGFVHRNNPGSFDGFTNAPLMDAEESCWGVTVYARWPDQVRVSQVGLPNVFHHKAQPTDYGVAPYREFLAWWVPVDDETHVQFTVAAVRLPPDKIRQYVDRREQRLAKRRFANQELAEKIIEGQLDLTDVDPESTDYLRLQDDVAQVGQGRIADHGNELLGQSDKSVVVLRRILARELEALEKGKPLKTWVYDRQRLDLSRGEKWEEELKQRLEDKLEPQKG